MSDRAFFLGCLAYLAANVVAVWVLRGLGFDGVGLVGYFTLFLLPAGIFGGAVIGSLVHAPLSGRIALTLGLAGLGALGMPLARLT